MGLNTIKCTGNWDGAASDLNNNFATITAEIEKLKAANVKFKGYYTSEATLKAVYSSPAIGDNAWVGATYPGTVYECKTAGTWSNTTKAPSTPSVQLADYATKTLLDVRTTEYNVSVQHPTSGIDGTNKYTLSGAIALVPSSLRTIGLKCSFLGEAGKVQTWEYQGGMFTNTSSWEQGGVQRFSELDSVNNKNALTLNMVEYTEQDGYLTSNGTYIGQSSYHSKSTPLIKCKTGDKFYYTGKCGFNAVGVIFFSAIGVIESSRNDISGENVEIIIGDGITHVMFSSNYPTNAAITLSVTNDNELIEIGKRLTEVENKISEEQSIYIDPILGNKKLGQAGDSISFGYKSDAIPSDDPCNPENIAIGSVSNSNKTYAYYMCKRTGMKWYNYGIAGSTMVDIYCTGYDRNGFSKNNGRYTQMATELDYITLFFGTNDATYGPTMYKEEWLKENYGDGTSNIWFTSSQSLFGTSYKDGIYNTEEQYHAVMAVSGEIGEKQLTGEAYWRAKFIGGISDSNNKTLYGAFNFVLPYLINKYPYAKIGIISPYSTDIFEDAMKNIAAKWGILALILTDSEINMIINRNAKCLTNTAYIDSSEYGRITLPVFRQKKLTSDNLHLTAVGHEYMSTIYENFMRKL